jgi:phenylacetic acid degradation operon negative regulatory protein
MSQTQEIPTRTLVLGMIRADGTLTAAEAYRIAEHVGMTEMQVRLCLRRLVAQGLLMLVSGRGLGSVFRYCGPADTDPLPERDFLRLADEQDAGLAPWDEHWRIVSFSIPEKRRAARDALRDHLRYIGGGVLGSGVYVSPHDWDHLVASEVARLQVNENVTYALCERLSVNGETHPPVIAQQLWDLDGVARSYDTFIERHGGEPSAADQAPRDPLAAVFRVVVDFARAASDDPLLPPNLLPARWPGQAARAILAHPSSVLSAARRQDDPANPLLLLTAKWQTLQG